MVVILFVVEILLYCIKKILQNIWVILRIMKRENTTTTVIEDYRIRLESTPITLYLKRSFNTAHSSSVTRTNFLIKTTLNHPINQQQQQSPVSGYGQCGLPPKKPFCYLSGIEDCQKFFTTIIQQFNSFHKQHFQPVSVIKQLLPQYYHEALDDYIDAEITQKDYAENLAFFKNKYKQLIQEGNKNNSGYITPQVFFYLQVFFLIKIGKELSHHHPEFKAPRNALQFSLLDLIGHLQGNSVSELLYNVISKFTINKNFSFYTISHEEDLQSMLQNAKDSLQFTDCIKIKFNNEVQKLVQLLKLMDQQNVGRRWIIDANASWMPQDYLKFEDLMKEIGNKTPSIKERVLFVQQPFTIFKSLQGVKSQQEVQKQQAQWSLIKQNSSFVIIADESFATCEDLKEVVGYSHGINIKMEKCGGPFEAFNVLNQMGKYKVNFLMFGSMVSTHLGCTQTFQFNEYACYFDIDGALLVKQPEVRGGFEWKGSEGIKRVIGNGLAINQKDLQKLF